MAYYLKKNGELDDKRVLRALKRAYEMYEDGAIIEARDLCIDIANSITDFEEKIERDMAV